MENVDGLVFETAEPRSIGVRIGEVSYTLREATESAAVTWKNYGANARVYDGEGKFLRVGDQADAEPLLVSLCLSQVPSGSIGPDIFVPLETIKSWRQAVVDKLYNWIMDNSGLREPETAEVLKERLADIKRRLNRLEKSNGRPASETTAKNLLDATMATST